MKVVIESLSVSLLELMVTVSVLSPQQHQFEFRSATTAAMDCHQFDQTGERRAEIPK
jgi:hypothetical protein